MTNEQLLNKYRKITDDIYLLTRATSGTYEDTRYHNNIGAIEDWCELEEMVKSLDERYNDRIIGICKRLDKALIVAKTINKINKLEVILDENIQYG